MLTSYVCSLFSHHIQMATSSFVIITLSIWILIWPSGVFRVVLWISLCTNIVPQSIKWFSWNRVHSISKLLLHSFSLCLTTMFLLWLFFPTFAIKSPKMSSTCWYIHEVLKIDNAPHGAFWIIFVCFHRRCRLSRHFLHYLLV